MSTIFLDRDGVINENRPSDYVKSWDEFHFLPGARESIAKLTYAGFRIVVCTNQAGIAYGRITSEALEFIHHRMCAEIAEVGGRIEQVYYCPHGKEEHCWCRKPRPGMLLHARDELSLDLDTALFIGDSASDIEAGMQARVKSILVLTGRGKEQLGCLTQSMRERILVFEDLANVTEAILCGSMWPLFERVYSHDVLALTSLPR